MTRPSTKETPVPAPDERLIDKVRALFDKAANTEFEAEAEAFYAKAQELMVLHAISEQHIRDAKPKGTKETPVVKAMYFTKDGKRPPTRFTQNYWSGRYYYVPPAFVTGRSELLHKVTSNNRCRTVFITGGFVAKIVGFVEDIEFCELLYHSLLAQALLEARKQRLTSSETNAFLCGFAETVGRRMSELNEVIETKGEPGNALALRDVKEQVDGVHAEAFPELGKMRGIQSVDFDGYHRGLEAGETADISGGRRNLSNRKELSA